MICPGLGAAPALADSAGTAGGGGCPVPGGRAGGGGAVGSVDGAGVPPGTVGCAATWVGGAGVPAGAGGAGSVAGAGGVCAAAGAASRRTRTGLAIFQCFITASLLIDAACQEPTVDDEHFAVHEAGALRCQEHRGPGELVEPAEPPHRSAQQKLLAARGAVEKRTVERSAEYPGHDRVDAHAPRAPLDGELASERGDAGLARRIGRDLEQADERAERRDVDDPAVAALEHRAADDLAGAQRAGEVGVED